jgi:DeoR family transcriptional regulator, copper-sensing transcriptional repressor
MLPQTRQEEIIRRLGERGEVKVSDLARQLGVAVITIQRDLECLKREGLLVRTRGGAVPYPKAAAPAKGATMVCSICQRPIIDRFGVYIHRPPTVQAACCPHCGLMVLAHMPDGSEWFATTADTLTGQTLNLRQATFVVGSAIAPCCSPSALCFGSRDNAARFARAFSGEPLSLEEAMHWMHRQMTRSQGEVATR